MKSELKEYTEKLKDDDPQKIICEVLCNLSANLKENEIFLSEADFQFSFAQELDKVLNKEKGIKSPRIILEYPFLTKDLYKEDNNKEGDNSDYDSKYCDYLKGKMCNKCRKKEKDKKNCKYDPNDQNDQNLSVKQFSQSYLWQNETISFQNDNLYIRV